MEGFSERQLIFYTRVLQKEKEDKKKKKKRKTRKERKQKRKKRKKNILFFIRIFFVAIYSWSDYFGLINHATMFMPLIE